MCLNKVCTELSIGKKINTLENRVRLLHINVEKTVWYTRSFSKEVLLSYVWLHVLMSIESIITVRTVDCIVIICIFFNIGWGSIHKDKSMSKLINQRPVFLFKKTHTSYGMGKISKILQSRLILNLMMAIWKFSLIFTGISAVYIKCS